MANGDISGELRADPRAPQANGIYEAMSCEKFTHWMSVERSGGFLAPGQTARHLD